MTNRAKLVAALGIALLGLAGLTVAIVLSQGGSEDRVGDLAFRDARRPPRATLAHPVAATIADIASAAVSEQDGELVFQAEMASSIPDVLEGSSLEWRWDLSDEGRATWIVSANLGVGLTAALVSQADDRAYSTIEGTFPGEVEVAGGALTITIDPSEIEDLPDAFDWQLATELVGLRADPSYSRARDRFPDQGTKRF